MRLSQKAINRNFRFRSIRGAILITLFNALRSSSLAGGLNASAGIASAARERTCARCDAGLRELPEAGKNGRKRPRSNLIANKMPKFSRVLSECRIIWVGLI